MGRTRPRFHIKKKKIPTIELVSVSYTNQHPEKMASLHVYAVAKVQFLSRLNLRQMFRDKLDV